MYRRLEYVLPPASAPDGESESEPVNIPDAALIAEPIEQRGYIFKKYEMIKTALDIAIGILCGIIGNLKSDNACFKEIVQIISINVGFRIQGGLLIIFGLVFMYRENWRANLALIIINMTRMIVFCLLLIQLYFGTLSCSSGTLTVWVGSIFVILNEGSNILYTLKILKNKACIIRSYESLKVGLDITIGITSIVISMIETNNSCFNEINSMLILGMFGQGIAIMTLGMLHIYKDGFSYTIKTLLEIIRVVIFLLVFVLLYFDSFACISRALPVWIGSIFIILNELCNMVYTLKVM